MNQIQAELTRCADPSCDGIAEPEQDGDHVFQVCEKCGMEFGFRRIQQTQGDCQLGIPEHVRRAYSPVEQPTPVAVSIGKKG